MNEQTAEFDAGRVGDLLAEVGDWLPWRVRLFDGQFQVVDRDNDVVALIDDGPVGDLIVAAVNALPALLTRPIPPGSGQS